MAASTFPNKELWWHKKKSMMWKIVLIIEIIITSNESLSITV